MVEYVIKEKNGVITLCANYELAYAYAEWVHGELYFHDLEDDTYEII